MADLLTGAVTAARCGTNPGSAKAELQRHIAGRIGFESLDRSSPSPEFSKFNLFDIQLAPRHPR
jgi:hypothetical protein